MSLKKMMSYLKILQYITIRWPFVKSRYSSARLSQKVSDNIRDKPHIESITLRHFIMALRIDKNSFQNKLKMSKSQYRHLCSLL